jgi:hypothetical protein
MTRRVASRGAGKVGMRGVDKNSDAYFDYVFPNRIITGKLGQWYRAGQHWGIDDYLNWMTFQEDISHGPEETPMIVW